ncbi:uncharacterized protein LOC103721406 [Phoenix dactylifera]|uniref:Uncharacterized protein LOC103721406 n=1 Tax=Phoenix dactylifera TaxID=42345 RepID=A0A8B7CZY2_PHODC|nr:uncharacterized protein LOC103721406 [Phoenix dactylifera]
MASRRWAYFRIMTGTVLGGILGFYVMHRVETSYKEKMKERLIKYENEMKKRGQLEQQKDQSELLSDS